ncbi:HAD family hydrolase [Maribacter sp. 2308TA10-17]|uniref:HAD family hydrolase n=1 Tax=Maribacter sp. 2308TA10-17 TaxID=3386276 RepID=UPI0039BD0C2A
MDIKIDENTVIVFDLDDTLYNEVDYLRSAYITLAKELEPKNWKHLFSILFSLYRNKENAFQFINEKYEINKEELIVQYRTHIPNITPFEGVIENFQQIKKKNGKIGVLTDGRSITQRNKLKSLGLLPFIDHIVISEEIGTEKPNEANFKFIENKFPSNTYYYIGDNFKKDFITPNRLGWSTIALVDNGLNIHSNSNKYTTEAHLPQHYIFSIQELNFI